MNKRELYVINSLQGKPTKLVADVISILPQLIKSVDESGWISVNDKEPPCDETVLICWVDSPDIEPEKDYMTCDENLDPYWVNYGNDKPTHWRTLPQPPKEQPND